MRRLKQDWEIFIAEGVTRRDVLDADDGRDVARETGIDVLALVGFEFESGG